MGHATGSILGVTVGSTHTEAKFALMTTSPYTDGGTVMYVQASGAIDQYDFVSIDENGQATALANAGGAAGHMLGCAQVAFADNDYGWVFIEGANFNGNGLASCAADTESLWTTGTAGHIDDATSAGAVRLNGVVFVTAVAAAATNREVIMRNARFVA